MSLKTFFRDARIQGGLSKLSQRDAAGLVAEFFGRFSYEACSADQLLALADVAQRAKDFGVAREALSRAALMPDKVHLAYYKMGRLELADGNPGDAADRFAWGTEVDPAFAYNWMGRARALAASGRKAEAAEFAERFVGFHVRPHTPEDLAALTDIADFLFEAGARERCAPIYALVREFGATSQRTAVRQAESLIAAGQASQALEVLRPVHAAGKLDVWGRRALAHCESQAGNHAIAIGLAESVVSERPEDLGFIATYLDVLVRSRDPQAWRDAVARRATILTPEAKAELTARLHLSQGEAVQAAAMLAPLPLQRQTRLFYVTVETGYAALGGGHVALAEALAERLIEVAPDVAAPRLLRTDIYLRQQEWDRAAETLSAMPPDEAKQPHVKLKWFEHSCFVGDIAKAKRLQAELEAGGLPSRQFTLPILRFLAEQQNWAELTDRALAWIGDDFHYTQIGYVLYRAAKRTGRQADFCAAIEKISKWHEHADLMRLHTALAWDVARSLADMQRVAVTAVELASPAMRHRMAVQRQMLARAKAPQGRRALFLCTNANYLCATIVALHSALENSAPGREDCFVIVDDNLAKRAEKLVQPFRKKGFSITVVPAGDVVDNAQRLFPTYGLFTSGHLLASAAYYRIFFARHLQKLGTYTRAVYIDSDVLVRTRLDALFAAELDGHPLAARVETPRPEVTRAIALHRLQGDLYFNSGVLLFDLTSPHLTAALDGAVAAIADDRVTLLFHDQCALNLGFRDRFARMGMEWNTPIAEETLAADLPADTAILHYLDRPKPWSAAYDGDCATLWLDQWARTAEVIGEAQALELFALVED
jgi:lipopolysaccharide biosynthesis glycosyltransferase/Tfp pilus assembly protein PilF